MFVLLLILSSTAMVCLILNKTQPIYCLKLCEARLGRPNYLSGARANGVL